MMRRKFSSAASAASMVSDRIAPRRERVASEEHAARRFLDGPDRSVRRDFTDHEADRAGAHVHDRHQLRRCRLVCVRPSRARGRDERREISWAGTAAHSSKRPSRWCVAAPRAIRRLPWSHRGYAPRYIAAASFHVDFATSPAASRLRQATAQRGSAQSRPRDARRVWLHLASGSAICTGSGGRDSRRSFEICNRAGGE